ncbi:tryptophan 7-halogenase [Bradyrhizobium sp. SSUT18]|uniref:NAD(P)/FAD-dependent oxidoreductase n=1 Tax=unclassified Bradyrhizobium TaxID=2631580 RepID=UPI0024472BD6|nr:MULTISPECIES: tryptophan 7-halogenase [unclassified Bradyrhizobium]MDH2353650.1 tryptophan 7-halogenase [Bradyrhizobium sp. SSUT112]MDH2406376.1 tryptophan 7-halogenase [Bradyrhizobium sp. SSUT18]
MAAFDIIVAGAGPAGAAASRTLAMCAPKLRVAVIAPDQRRGRGQGRGEVLSPLVQPVLRQLGLWPTFLTQGFAPSHRTLTSWEEAGLTSSELLLDARGPSWRVDRARFDGWIATEACSAAERFDARIAHLEREAEGWSVACDDGNSHSARLIIDATGRGRALAHRQGLRARAQDRLIAVYAEATTSGQAAPELLVEAFEDGWWYTMALGEGRRAFACMTDADLARGLRLNTPDGWRTALARTQFVAALASKVVQFETHHLVAAGSRYAATTVGFRLLCAGDAASAFDPISGHGVVKAMRSGVFAAYAASDCLERGDAAALDRYGAWVAREAAVYATALGEHYGSVSRWTERPFWRRRRADMSSRNSSSSLSEQQGRTT